VIRGEGELSFGELVERLQRGGKPIDVAGVSWRDDEQVVDNPARRLVEDLDQLPMPRSRRTTWQLVRRSISTSDEVAPSRANFARRLRSGNAAFA